MRLLEDKTNQLTALKYHYELLVKYDIVERHQIRVNREILLDELQFFRMKFHEHEKNLVSIHFNTYLFVEIYRLCISVI